MQLCLPQHLDAQLQIMIRMRMMGDPGRRRWMTCLRVGYQQKHFRMSSRKDPRTNSSGAERCFDPGLHEEDGILRAAFNRCFRIDHTHSVMEEARRRRSSVGSGEEYSQVGQPTRSIVQKQTHACER